MVSRRAILGTAAGAALGVVAGCGTTRPHPVAAPPSTAPGSTAASAHPAASSASPKVIGDGSTQDTGPQPHQPAPRRLEAGEKPPQFVVFSWDGAANAELFERFRGVSQEIHGAMTFFLSGLYLLPKRQRMKYRPPQHPVGSSAIGFLSDKSIRGTLGQLGPAWQEGHEIGTHFNGHFCGDDGVQNWSPSDWDSEIDQAISFVANWRTNTGFHDLPALPFDYKKELIGGRTPCLEGRSNLLKAKRVQNWKYDSSGTGTQVWPKQFKNGLWNVPMQQIPFPGHSFEVISMDYNMMFNQSGTPNGSRAMHATWQRQAREAYLAGFKRAYETNRAPLIIGNHFERWNSGIYMDAVEQAAHEMASHDDVQFVSFRQLVKWLEVQDPAVLRSLRSLPVGDKPSKGWSGLLS